MSVESRIFVDTNVLVYAYDVEQREKHGIARDLLIHLWETRRGALSTQVLQEFYVTVTRKLARPLDRATARRVVATYQVWPMAIIDPTDILAASEVEERFQLSFWDALILSAARKVNADRLLSEDFQTGRTIDGILVENPFVTR
jgi:predicted nucleic acid-binding protein